MVTTFSKYLPKPVARYLEFYLDFNGYKCSISQSYGPGDFMKQWSAASKDGRCIVFVDIQSFDFMIRLDGLIHHTKIEPQEIYENDIQQLWYPKIRWLILSWPGAITQILKVLDWPAIEAPALFGTNISQWFQFSAEINGPHLKRLQIYAAAGTQPGLSHSSALIV
ncbi:hypothetical protein CPB97_009912 [Podila verticillata]|nr:hypothetical protein CPB97_009912 [Podila verticillata]